MLFPVKRSTSEGGIPLVGLDRRIQHEKMLFSASKELCVLSVDSCSGLGSTLSAPAYSRPLL